MVYSSADSPDGTIWLSPADGGADQLVTTGQDPHLSPNGRYLVDGNGVPYLIVGDSPQSLIVNLSEANAAM